MSDRVSIKRTVYFDIDTEEYCMCKDDFFKTCSLRVANNLNCKESIVSITPIVRNEFNNSIIDLDNNLKNLYNNLKTLNKKGFKIR